jgi:protein TonB
MKMCLLSLLLTLNSYDYLQRINNVNCFNTFYQDCNFPIPAKYCGGNKAWAKYLQKNTNSELGNKCITIPKGKNSARVTVVVSFVISKWGYVTNVERAPNDTIKVHPKLLAESVRVIKASPRWVAERLNGKGISSRKYQAITWIVDKE